MQAGTGRVEADPAARLGKPAGIGGASAWAEAAPAHVSRRRWPPALPSTRAGGGGSGRTGGETGLPLARGAPYLCQRGCAATTPEPGRTRARGRATPTLGLGPRPVRRLDPRRGRTAASTRADAGARPRPRPAPPGAPTLEPDRLDPHGRAALQKEMRETRVGRKR